jgi:hypothetical protein
MAGTPNSQQNHIQDVPPRADRAKSGFSLLFRRQSLIF